MKFKKVFKSDFASNTEIMKQNLKTLIELLF